jgi:hypothetical protein
MSNAVLLNNIEHKDVKVDAKQSAKYGDSVNRSLVFSTEFGDLQKEYPILFFKDLNTNTFQSHVILGFDRDENLFLDENGWRGNYVPAMFARGPFLIGYQQQDVNGSMRREPVVHIDTVNPRVGTGNGEPVFLPFGGESPYLQKVMKTLQLIEQGAAFDKLMFASFEAEGLLEPVAIDITLSNIREYKLVDYYTINEEKLAQLSGEGLEKLHQSGVLKLAYFALSSLGNIKKLIELKNKKSSIT